MSIKTDLTREDYVAFVKHVGRTVSAVGGDRLVRMLIAVAIGLGIGLTLSLLHISLHQTSVAAMICGAFAGGFLMVALINSTIRRQMRRMQPAEDGYILGSQETSLGDEGLRQASGRHHSLFDWSLVRSLTLTEQHIFIMVDRAAGIIVPRRAFSSGAECEQFVAELERRSGKVKTES